jgi:hypothetical protein
MSSLARDRLLATPLIAPATPSTPRWRLTAEEEATAVAELKQATAGWAALLAECAGPVCSGTVNGAMAPSRSAVSPIWRCSRPTLPRG